MLTATVPLTGETLPDLADGLDLPCRTHNPDLWFADAPADLEKAKSFCGTCPVRVLCLEYALDMREPYGIWGGLNEYERRRALARKAG